MALISQADRDLAFLGWSPELNLYARALTRDANASSRLVHDALSAAFAAPIDTRDRPALKAALYVAIDKGFATYRTARETRRSWK